MPLDQDAYDDQHRQDNDPGSVVHFNITGNSE